MKKKKFLITDIENTLRNFPIKYLDIYLNCFEKLDQNQMNFGFFNISLTYSNKFINHAINKIIVDI